MSQTRHRHWSTGVGQAGFGLLLMGLFLVIRSVAASGPQGLAAEVAALEPRDHTGLFGISRSEKVLVEGTIDREATVLHAPFVAYTRERQVRDSRDDVLWVADGQDTPPMRVTIPGGAIQLAEADYRLSGDLTTVIEGGHRYAGIAPGDPVVVMGYSAPGAGGGDFIATDMVRGTRTDYTRRRIDRISLLLGASLAVSGAGLMGWLLRQGYSPFSRSATGK